MAAALEPGWNKVLEEEFEKDYMKGLKAFLQQERAQGFTVYPKNSDIFNALNYTPFDEVEVVILGQDPYHGPGQAHGLSFSVQDGVPLPPSLKNIFKELEAEIPGYEMPQSGNLTRWAEQGVLLLNATLTVRAANAGSHQQKGWEQFTDAIIKALSEKKKGLVFLLWGNYAKQKGALIDQQKHHVLTAAHPSPFSAYNGFFGSGHFVKANQLLEQEGKRPIAW